MYLGKMGKNQEKVSEELSMDIMIKMAFDKEN